jgi:fucose 4-O-acetylase-like acetyltransferase
MHWIDLAKTAGIVLVVIGHTPMPLGLKLFIYAFHLPLFFFLSGYLEKGRGVKETLIHGAKTLLLPYLLLYLIFYLYWVLFEFWPSRGIHADPLATLLRPLTGLIFAIGRNTTYSYIIPYVAPIWFLPGLFFTKLLHALIQAVSRRFSGWRIAYFAIALFILFLWRLVYFHDMPSFSINSAFMAFPYFYAGYLLRRADLMETLSRIRPPARIAIALIGYVIVCAAAWFNEEVDINNFITGNDFLLMYLCGLTGIASTILLASLYRSPRRAVSIISSGTVFIMASHGLVNIYLYRLLELLGIQYNSYDAWTYTGTAVLIAMCIINVLLTIPVIMLIRRFAPVLLGGRK